MNKKEYLARLSSELKKNNVADAEDVVNEYEQHFAFKTADGFSEEEISVKLGEPATLASQFANCDENKKTRGRKITTGIGLIFADIFAAVFFVLLFAWETIMAAFSLASATLGVCLLGNLNIYSLIPSMPYYCGAIFGLSFIALAVLAAVGCIYFAAFIRQLMRSYGRVHHNVYAAASGKAILPYLAISPQLPAKVNRRIRTVALFSLVIFAALFVLGMVVSMISSGSLGFWHAWGWFNYYG